MSGTGRSSPKDSDEGEGRKVLGQGIPLTLGGAHDAEKTTQVVRRVAAVICCMGAQTHRELTILEDASVLRKEAKQQAGQEHVKRMPLLVAFDIVRLLQVVIETSQFFCGLAIGRVLVDHRRLLQSRPGQKIRIVLCATHRTTSQAGVALPLMSFARRVLKSDDDKSFFVRRLPRCMLHRDMEVLAPEPV